ncbi:MAG: GtrA family protein [Clostridioides sp.]|jgi:putative flippase GtrA|nr:GtrA family protein [Clostridioides sp.]
MNTFLTLYKKYKEIILYIFFGGLTTVVNFVSYFIFKDLFNIHYLISNSLAWFISVLFAYITNKRWVFESKSENIFKEFFMFFNMRVLSGIIDIATMYVLVDFFNLNDFFAKCFTQIIVVVLNYIFSKLIIFKNTNPAK